MEFGRRLVWNITRGPFGSQSSPVVLASGVPIKGIRLSDAVNQESWDPRTSGMSALAGHPIQALQADGERLAIVAAVISLHWTPTDGRRVYMQLRPTIRLVNTQPTEAVLPLRSAEAR
jgi:hypothetical protein